MGGVVSLPYLLTKPAPIGRQTRPNRAWYGIQPMIAELLDDNQKLMLFLGFLATAPFIWLAWFLFSFGATTKHVKDFVLSTLSLIYLCGYAIIQLAVWIVIIGVAVLLVVGVVFLIIKGVKFVWYF